MRRLISEKNLLEFYSSLISVSSLSKSVEVVSDFRIESSMADSFIISSEFLVMISIFLVSNYGFSN